MGSWAAFLLIYLFGGVTFVPLIIVTIYFTAPIRIDLDKDQQGVVDDIIQPGDDTTELEPVHKGDKGEPARSRYTDVSDVAAGYFAVCREYTPMGINAKPIERSTPLGPAAVAAPSRSVYQAMYQTIFDRKQGPNPLEKNNGASSGTANVRPKRAGNVFYVVLRHGHLMLFDDDAQLEVRHVISLAHHNISVYSGGDKTPEGELFIKRNALCLSRKTEGTEMTADTQLSKPFYLFSENCSAKEDFYFALLKNQEQVFGATKKAPQPLQFEVRNIISLVQRLHSTEEHMQTRWLNALLGRIFLGVHKTHDIENFIREKITKKISRVNRPSFLSRISIRKIDTGESAPFITNPRLKDLTVEGDFGMEADIKYTGNFRIEVAATARIDLGPRFKAREVNLLLAVVLKKLEGHIVFKIKPPPSNRIWFSFQTMPKMEMTIEPVVSSRQITYTVILRQIENRIKEVVAETLVHPFWDDVPFFRTEHKEWRGGIFEGDDAVEHSEDHEEIAAALGHVDEVASIEDASIPTTPTTDLPPIEKSHSFPNIENAQSAGFWGRKLNSKKSTINNSNSSPSTSTTNIEVNSSSASSIITAAADPPLPVRIGSFSASTPTISTDPAHADTFKPSSSPPDGDDAARTMANVAARSRKGSVVPTSMDPSAQVSHLESASTTSYSPSSETPAADEEIQQTPTIPERRSTVSSVDSMETDMKHVPSPTPSIHAPIRSVTGSIGRNFFAKRDKSSSTSSETGAGTPDQKRMTLAAVSNAAATAKRWGWNAIQRHGDQAANGRKISDPPMLDLNQPMGRGQPLPPPGTPLPRPDRRSKVTPIPIPKRKPVPPPTSAHAEKKTTNNETKSERRPVLPPPLPRRRRISEAHLSDQGNYDDDNVLVVEAPPPDSEPSTPLGEAHEPYDEEAHNNYLEPWTEHPEGFGTMADDLTSDRVAPGQITSETIEPELATRHIESEPSLQVSNIQPAEDEDDDYSGWLDNPEFDSELEVEPAVEPVVTIPQPPN
ncbi:hypothetical protein BX600DRAFT_437299 [Xylariales sp. PMI_506]|nr:hypothetical protein BX600DRAFT_437299 [Xylariales sp. PMI_506]